MLASSAEVRAKLESGRKAAAESLRQLADRLETLPLDDAAEALVWVQDALTTLQREAARIFERMSRE
jgi:hypothetical protein